MTAVAGRKVKLYSVSGTSETLVAGGRAHGITINNEAIDITDKGDDGWRTLIADAATRSVDISFEGVMRDSVLLGLSLGSDTSKLLADYKIKIDGVGDISGDFHLSSIELGTPHDDATELSGTLASSGPITFSAAA